MHRGFIYEDAPYPECHASTIAETDGGLVAAWFGGTAEKDDDVSIWVARRQGDAWTGPVEVADGVADGIDLPCWNPVLWQEPGGPLVLFYKVGPSPQTWWGMRMTSGDGGRTWSEPMRLPGAALGPVRNKPIRLDDGSLLAGSSTEDPRMGWRVHMERTADLGQTWRLTGPLNDGTSIGAIQPAFLEHGQGVIQALCRTRQGRIGETWSRDGGETWSDMELIDLPNPNSGIDAVSLRRGRATDERVRHVLVYNHVETPAGAWGGARTPLNLAVSPDGRRWFAALVLEDEPGEYSYPAVIEGRDGMLHITYTWKRQRVRYVVVDPARLNELRDLSGSGE